MIHVVMRCAHVFNYVRRRIFVDEIICAIAIYDKAGMREHTVPKWAEVSQGFRGR